MPQILGEILQVVKTSVQLRSNTFKKIVCQFLPKKRIPERMKEQLIDIPVLQSFCSSGISCCVVTRLCTVNVHVEKKQEEQKNRDLLLM